MRVEGEGVKGLGGGWIRGGWDRERRDIIMELPAYPLLVFEELKEVILIPG